MSAVDPLSLSVRLPVIHPLPPLLIGGAALEVPGMIGEYLQIRVLLTQEHCHAVVQIRVPSHKRAIVEIAAPRFEVGGITILVLLRVHSLLLCEDPVLLLAQLLEPLQVHQAASSECPSLKPVSCA